MEITDPQMFEPYRIARDTWVVPEVMPALPGTVIPLNSMVITGSEPVIVDTGNELSRTGWLEAAFSVVEPSDVRWVFLSHDDHDHIGNLQPVLEACPNAVLVTNWFTVERTRRALELPLERMRWVNDGETFDAGDRTLVAKMPPLWDSPTTRGLFDPTTGVYWAVDAFASLLHTHVHDSADVPAELWRDSLLTLNRTNSPWHTLLDTGKFDRHVDTVASLGITTIASAHGAPLHGSQVADAFGLIRQVPLMDAAPLPGQADLEAILAAGLAVA